MVAREAAVRSSSPASRRSGTTWVGRMLTVSGELGYINEPFNLSVSPGSFRVPAEHWYTYVSEENEGQFLPALEQALAFEYPARSRTQALPQPGTTFTTP